MKFQPNEKYRSIAVYACILSAVTVFVVALGLRFSEIGSEIGTFLSYLNPLFIGFAVAYLLNPIMNFFEKHLFSFRRAAKPHKKLGRCLSVILAYLLLIFLLGLLPALILPQLAVSYSALTSQMAGYAESAAGFLAELENRVPFLDLDKMTGSLQNLFSDSYTLLQKLTPHLTSFVSSLFSQMTNAFLGLILSVYFLLYRDRLLGQCRRLAKAFLSEKHRRSLSEFVRITDVTFGGFIRGKLLDSLIIGILTFVCMLIFRMPYPQMISVIIGVTNIIPFFGPFIGAIPAAFIVFIASPGQTVWFLLMILVIQQLDGNVIGPKILGQSIGISSFGVIVSILIMGGLFGFFGMLLGVPLFALILTLFSEFTAERLKKRGFDESGNPVTEAEADISDAGIPCEPAKKATDSDSTSAQEDNHESTSR